MATGGSSNAAKLTMSEPRNGRSTAANRQFERTSQDGGSVEDRLNNWEFLHWQPTAMVGVSGFDNSKRVKRGNEEREKLKEWEGKDCPVCPEDSSPHAERKRRTPLTFPRTRAGTSTRHGGMENLRQHLTFSDAEELDRASTDGERNNGRYVQLPPKRDHSSLECNTMSSPTTRGSAAATSVRDAGRDNTVTRNLNRDEAQPDSNQIVGRLMQIRDYIKQASTMMDKLQASLDPGDMNRAGQLEQVILRLKEQEKKYLELLLELSVARDDNLFSGRHNDTGGLTCLTQHDTESETTELEEVQSDTTDGTADDTRPRIEDHLGIHSDTDQDDTFGVRPVIGATALNPTPRPNDLDGNSDGEPQPSPGHSTDLVQRRHVLETDLLKKSDELEALKEQYNLLRKVLVQKEELQSLQHRQATLLSLQDAAGNSLTEIRSTRNTVSEAPDGATAVAVDASPNPPKRDDSDATSDATGTEETADNVDAAVAAIAADMGFTIESSGDVVPDDLRDLRHRLNYLKNLYDIKEQLSDGVNQVDSQEPKSVAELSALAQERHLLESKLQDLQQKKEHMDSLLSDLQSLRSTRRRAPSNNELEAGSTTSSQVQVNEVVATATLADRKSTEAREVLDMLDTRNKMKKLHEVRDRLDQLKDLAQYYQGGSEFVRGADGATYAIECMSLPSEYDKPENRSGERDGMNEFLKIYQQLASEALTVEDTPAMGSAQALGGANPMGRNQPQGSTRPKGRSQPQGGAQAMGIAQAMGLAQVMGGAQAMGIAQAMGGNQVVGGAIVRKENDEGDVTRAVENFIHRGENAPQLNVDIDVWEDDPEVMAKVRRLQTAKEKLHRLQELVAMVQQSSSDAVLQTLPSSIAELASDVSLDDTDTATRPVTAVVPHSRPAGGASGGMVAAAVPQPAVVTGCPFGQREAFYKAKVKQQQHTLEELMDEKCKLLAIQDELQRLHETLPEAAAAVHSSTDRTQQKDATATSTSSAIKRQSHQQNDGGEQRSHRVSSEVATSLATTGRGGPETAQVTFQEPLETVVSNEELYDRMRQQRMLREELREKKRELEYMMSKDRPRKQYSRNQDTQSDNMSYSAKSDPFGASASVDVTMATWGGSTVDNLESIEEDENVSGDGQECDDDNDDGYPSDGIMQVEEEEEANGESDDHATYTIEDEYASRRRQTSMPSNSQHVGQRRRRSKVRSAPQTGRELQQEGDYAASSRRYWPSSQSDMFLSDTRGGAIRQPATTTRRKQHSKSSPRHPNHKEAMDPLTTRYLQQQLTSVRSDLNNVTQLLHILMRENPSLAATGHSEEVVPPMVSAVPDMLSAPLAPVSGTTQVLRQQQQLIANLSHSFNELLSQQGELVQRFSQLECWLAAGAVGSQVRNNTDFTLDLAWENNAASTRHGGPRPTGSPLGRGRQWVPPGGTSYDAGSSWSQPFEFQQHTSPGKAVALKPPQQQHHTSDAPLSRGGSTKELPFPIVSGDSGGATWRSGVITGTRSRGLQTTFDSRTPMTTELLASRDSIEVIKSSPALSSDRHRRLPDRSEPSIKFCEVPMAGGATIDSDGESDVESICIETIQAADTKDEIPRLDLSEVTARSHRSRAGPKAGSSQMGGTGFTGEAVVGHKFTAARRAGAAAKLASQLVKSQPRCSRNERESGKTQSQEGSQSTGAVLREAAFYPGLSSGISGTAFLDAMSNSSRRSSVQSSMAGDTDQLAASLRRVRAVNNPALNSDVESDAPPSEFSLFEALRETIYSEVATLISQNESRPHFLIELFRELQLLTSDYLRQRALYAVKDLVTQYLAEGHKDGPEEKKVRDIKSEMSWSAPPARHNLSELTPSESLATSEDEEVKAHVYAQRAQAMVKREHKAQQMAALQPMSADGWRPSTHGCRFDYLENVEITSSQSTPSTSSSHLESPFARESLGDTVIHMDKISEPSSFDTAAYIEHETLKSMREHERKLLEGECRSNGSPSMPKPMTDDTSGMSCQRDDDRSDVGSSSAQDQGSEGSTSDVTYPRIDTQQLDGEIKAIMLSVLPVLQEHMDDVCSQQLLEYVRQLVLSLTKPKGDNHEFLQFFNNQLNTILADSLAKFDGRKMRDCGEDLLGELSEILFNELAFFRLMEDLNSTKSKVKATLQQWCHQESQTSSDAGATAGELQRVSDVLSDAESSSTSSSSNSADDWQSEESERSGVEKGSKEMKKGKEVTGDIEEEDLGKARDDAFAAVVDIDEREDEEKDTDTLQTSSVNFQLVPSELKPYTRIGSDEDDEGDDNEVASADDPSETAVSRDAEKDRCSNDSDDDTDTTLSRASVNTNGSCSEGVGAEEGTEEGEWVEVEGCVDIPNGMAIDPEDSVTENSCGDDRSIKLVDSKVTADGPVVAALSTEASVVSNPNTTDAPVGKLDNPASIKCMAASGESGTVTPHGTPGSPNIQPVNGNGKLENGHADEEEVTIDDLPPKLVHVVKDAEPVVTEDIPLDTQTIVDMITPSGGELAGSSDAIKEPDSIPPNGTLKHNGTDPC